MAEAEEFGSPAGETDPEDQEEQRSSGGWLPWVVFAAIVLLVAWLLWNYADFGQDPAVKVTSVQVVTARVPDVVGLTEAQAAASIDAAGFEMDSEAVYDSLEPEGVVANQEPAGGVHAMKGSTVVVSVSTGTGSETGTSTDDPNSGNGVPDVIGLSEDLAISALERSGFKVSVSYAYGDAAQGVVFIQSPAPGEPGEPGSTVRVTVSLGQRVRRVTMPDVLGLSESAAKAKIVATGLDPRPMYQPKVSKLGYVYEQSPKAGTVLDEGTKAFYLVAVAP